MNKAEFQTRTLTGLGIGAVTLGAVLLSPYSYMAWLGIIAGLGAREYLKLVNAGFSSLYSLVIPAVASIIVWLTGIGLIRQWPLVFAMAIIPMMISVLVGFQLVGAKEVDSVVVKGKVIMGVMAYIVMGCVSGCLFLFEGYDWKYVLLPILLIWLNDIAAYIIGSRYGNRKIAPSISPGKSIEGTAGAAVLTAIIGFGFTMIWPDLPMMYPVVLGIFIPFFALAGDLWESALKRQAGVKDSGNLLPGHGGILDRYDSLLFVMPFSAFVYFIFVL